MAHDVYDVYAVVIDTSLCNLSIHLECVKYACSTPVARILQKAEETMRNVLTSGEMIRRRNN